VVAFLWFPESLIKVASVAFKRWRNPAFIDLNIYFTIS